MAVFAAYEKARQPAVAVGSTATQPAQSGSLPERSASFAPKVSLPPGVCMYPANMGATRKQTRGFAVLAESGKAVVDSMQECREDDD